MADKEILNLTPKAVPLETDSIEGQTSGGGAGSSFTSTLKQVFDTVGSKAQVVTVASAGGNFTTIQGAINSISDASIVKGYVVIVSPGTYTENLTLKAFVDVVTNSDTGVNLIGTITGSGGDDVLRGFNISVAATTSVVVASTASGSLGFIDVGILITTATDDIQPTAIKSTGTAGIITRNTTVTYINTSTGANNSPTYLIDHQGSGDITTLSSNVIASTDQLSGNVSALRDASSGTSIVVLDAYFAVATNASFSGELKNIERSGNSGGVKSYSTILATVIGAGTGTGICFELDSSTDNETIDFTNSSCNVSGFTNNISFRVGNGDTVNPSFVNVGTGTTFEEIGTGQVNGVVSKDNELRVNTAIIDENLLLGTPTNETLQSFFNIIWGAGVVSGGEVTDGGGGTVNVTAGQGLIRNTNSEMAPIFSFDWDQSLGLALAEGNNVVYIDYNAGSPVVAVTQNRNDILDNENDKFELVEVVREGTDLHISDHRQLARSQGQQKSYSLQPVERADRTGLILGETGTRNVTMTQGSIWRKYVRGPVSAVDTSAADTFDSYYTADSFSTWTKVADDTQWNNTQYNDITSGLVSLSPASRFSFQDFYINGDGELTRVYAQAQYASLSAAEEAPTSSSLPPRLQFNSLLIGRIVFQGNDATAQSILSAFDVSFSGAAVTDHGALSGLADNDHPQYGLVASPLSQFAATSSAQLISIISDETGTGSLVFSNAPAFTGNATFDTNTLAIDATNNRVSIGHTTPSSSLDIQQINSSVGGITFRASVGGDQNQFGRIKLRHYNAAQEPSTGIIMQNTVGNNTMFYGGSSSSENAVTEHIWYTAVNSVTVTGTEAMRIDEQGDVGLGETSPAGKLDVAGAFRATAGIPENAQTGTTYTPVLSDAGKEISLNNASSIAFTVPTNASVPYEIGAILIPRQKGAGQVTFSGTPTINNVNSHTKTEGQFAYVALKKVATDEWDLFGQTAA